MYKEGDLKALEDQLDLNSIGIKPLYQAFVDVFRSVKEWPELQMIYPTSFIDSLRTRTENFALP